MNDLMLNVGTNKTIEDLCKLADIKGLITYTESDNYIAFKNYIYNKNTGNLLIKWVA